MAHSYPEGIGLGPIPDRGAVVIKPGGWGKGYEVIAQLTLTDLIDLGRYD